MAVYFSGGQVLFRGSYAAMDVACCDCGCVYVNNGLPGCAECAASDDPHSTFATVPDVQISLASIASGTNTGCGSYEGGPAAGSAYAQACEGTVVASNSGFFNNDFVLSPCTSTFFTDCVDLGCQVNSTPYFLVVPWRVVELSKLAISYNPVLISSVRTWVVTATLESWVIGTGGNNAATICNGAFNVSGAISLGYEYVRYSYRKVQFEHRLAMPTFDQYRYDETLAPPEACTDNDRVTVDGGCVASSTSIPQFSATVTDTTCKKALSFTGATCSVATV